MKRVGRNIPSLTRRELLRVGGVSLVGGYLNAFTSEELTCFHVRACADRFDELLDVLADMFLHSRFAPVDIARERDVIKEEIAMYLDQPHHHVQELLNATLWPDQPLGRPITGTNESLDVITRRHLLAYLDDHYVTGSTLVVAAGAEPLHALYRTTCRPVIERRLAAGALRTSGVLGDPALRVVRVEEAELRTVDPALRFLAGVNEPADLP